MEVEAAFIAKLTRPWKSLSLSALLTHASLFLLLLALAGWEGKKKEF